MFFNRFKTFILFFILNGLLVSCGYLIGGFFGLAIILGISTLFNIFVYYKSDTLVAKMLGATPLVQKDYPAVYEIVEELCTEAKIKIPKLWLWETKVANACATGRNPDNASVVVTTGILGLLDNYELRAVLAHEISHITNYDILIGTIAAIVAAAISYIFDLVRFRYYFGSRRDSERDNSTETFFILLLASAVIAPLLQLAIGRTREFMADESGAKLCRSPLELASALKKIESYSLHGHYMDESSATNKAFSSIFFTSPFKKVGSWLSGLFSTHPPVEERVKRLKNMKF